MEIVAKFRDALSMFWQALDDSERRLMMFAAAYVAAGIIAEASKRSRARTVAQIRDEVLAEVRHGR